MTTSIIARTHKDQDAPESALERAWDVFPRVLHLSYGHSDKLTTNISEQRVR